MSARPLTNFVKGSSVKTMKNIHRRNIRFKNYVAKSDKKRLLGVSLDTSKTFHRVLIYDFLGKVKIEPFSINTLGDGYEELKRKIKIVEKRMKAERVYIALETPAKYTRNLIYHLQKDFKRVVVVSPYEVAQNRKQTTFRGLKTDEIDAGAVADLMVRGEFLQINKSNNNYIRLNNLVYWREQKLTMRAMIKNQIHHRFEKIFPGINCEFDGKKKLFTQPFISYLHKGLLNIDMTPQEILEESDNFLTEKFGYKDSTFAHNIRRLKNRLNEMLLPEEKEARIDLDFLSLDRDLLRVYDLKIDEIEKEIVEIGSQTSAKYLFNQIKGVNELSASIYVGLIGDFRRFKSAGHIYSYAGLSPKRRQSGSMDLKSIGIKRAGNRLLRCMLFRMANQVIVSDPFYNAYYKRLKSEKQKSWKEGVIIICKKLNKVFYALMRDEVPYSRLNH